MKNRDVLATSLAVVGTALVWIPVLAPLLLSVAHGIAGKVLRFDYLMPAELFPLALGGGGILFWVTIRVHSHKRMVGSALAIAVFLLVGGQVLAVVTGLASGTIEPSGWRWALVLTTLAGYSLAVVALGIGGLLLVRELLKKPASPKMKAL